MLLSTKSQSNAVWVGEAGLGCIHYMTEEDRVDVAHSERFDSVVCCLVCSCWLNTAFRRCVFSSCPDSACIFFLICSSVETRTWKRPCSIFF